ncbi:DNA cytosine methyltransferase [Kingella kingae]|nr:DNA cytosine methyltransferase [Kingella kingae]MDK4623709.1 DNA cytosine methyltransferase [Kingella kingae]MDK4659349.1 DNA cytosine methyltransferase [Kingella kingae]MDK4667581.1 DNA cytosine methyltransferase [Kingella kingae]MDK4685988.1 DNA cytosine methyltransferase [Kingella kingae]
MLNVNEKLKNPVQAPLFSNHDNHEMKPQNIIHQPLKAIDLFAGVGGIRLGFQQVFQENIEFVFSSELDKFACQTYYANHHEQPHGDITQIQAADIPAHDMILAGFPCQAFSMAGLRKGFEDTRGTLFFEVARIAKYHQPKIIFLENVKGFKNHDKGNTFATIKLTLEQLGYRVYADVLNAKNFGVPQNRERIYIIAVRNDFNQLGMIDFERLKQTAIQSKVGDILQNQVDEKYTISDKLWAGHQRRKEEHKQKGNGFGYSMFTPQSAYTSTISARYYKDGSEILIEQAGKNPRKLTPREAGRLQGFPDDFIIPVSDVQAYKQFGNSVAVPVIRALANEIKQEFFHE